MLWASLLSLWPLPLPVSPAPALPACPRTARKHNRASPATVLGGASGAPMGAPLSSPHPCVCGARHRGVTGPRAAGNANSICTLSGTLYAAVR